MRIGLIGTGNIGTTVARRLSQAGHTLLIANSRGPETIGDLAAEIGASAVTAEEAVRDVDVVILSVPMAKIPLMKELLAQAAPGTVVADMSNYYPYRDGQIPALDAGQVESLWVTEQIGRPLVKAWNTVLSGSIETKSLPKGAVGRIALPVAGDDDAAKKTVMSLVEDTGFDAIDAGSLEDSWRLQPGNPCYCTDLDADELHRALETAERSRAPQLRDQAVAKLMEFGDKLTMDDLLGINRSLFLQTP
ncbi:NADPH-dependent F420 reductase [Streptomyces mirabilis]|uniref:NADPH-dependent F420 reductase n=1 Tax=Streptomyces mirabilis TaxID=68239 RepID=UPI0036A34A6F